MTWFKIQDQQVKINILAKPNAKKTAIVGVSDKEILISLHAKPHQGEANEELIAFLAKLFRLPKRQIVLQYGEKSKHKQIVVPLVEKVQQFISECKC